MRIPDFHRDSTLVLEHINQAMTVGEACAKAEVPSRTFNDWLSRGRAEYKRRAQGELPRDTENKFLDLFVAVKDAQAANPPHRKPAGPKAGILEYKADILNNIRQGMKYKDACEAAGSKYRTFRDWVERGERELERVDKAGKRGRVKDSEAVYVDLVNELRKSKAQGKQSLIGAVYMAGTAPIVIKETKYIQVVQEGKVTREETHVTERVAPPDAKMALAILERRHKDEWARRSEVTGAGGKDFPVGGVSINNILPGWENLPPEVRENVVLNLGLANGSIINIDDPLADQFESEFEWDEVEAEGDTDE